MEDNNKTNLIINYLPQTLSDVEFKSLFQTIGPVKSSKIVRHKTTGYSYGFGFIDYLTESDAVRAIQTLNGFQMQNKKIKVAYARPGGETIKNANLYVRGIPKDMDQDELEKIFGDCGNIIQCRLLKDDITGENKGVAFILYDLRDQAELAMEKYSGMMLTGASEPVSIKFAEDNAKKIRAITTGSPIARMGQSFRGGLGGGPLRQNNAQNKYRYNPMTGTIQYGMGALTVGEGAHTLFVYNIGIDTDEKSLWQLFSQYGTIQKVNIIRDSSTGLSKGYGFISMSNYDEAIWAIENLNGFRYAGRPLQVSFKTQK